jgi:FAD binding domain
MDLTPLRSRVAGPVLGRDDPGFAEECTAWVLNFALSPEVVVGVTSPSDVSEAVKFAAANSLPIRVQGTGHGAEVQISDGILITTRRLDAVTVDASASTATVGAGVPWSAVVNATAPYGLAPVTGSSVTVGVVGFVLGGGLGPLSRSFGFGSDHAIEFEIVLADGSIVRANATDHPDLFWALRGGKGGLGVVTSVTLRLHKIPNLYAGSLMFDAPNIEPALRAWLDYTTTAHDDVCTSAAILRMPDAPFIPEPLRGHTLLSVRFAFAGDTATGEELAAPLRAAAPVYLDDLGPMPLTDVDRIHGDPPNPTVSWLRGTFLDGADQTFATALLGVVGPDQHVPFIGVEVRHLGSAIATDVEGGSAVGGRQAKYSLSVIGAPDPHLFESVLPGIATGLFGALRPWIATESNVNFVAPFADRAAYEAAWPVGTFAKLMRLRNEYDPLGLFAYGVAAVV